MYIQYGHLPSIYLFRGHWSEFCERYIPLGIGGVFRHIQFLLSTAQFGKIVILCEKIIKNDNFPQQKRSFWIKPNMTIGSIDVLSSIKAVR